MPRKKGEAISPDALAKSFIKYYNLATQKELAMLNARLDRIEDQLKALARGQNTSVKYKVPHSRKKVTSGDMVYDVIKRSKKGLRFSEIQLSTGFGDKTIRNLIYRLHQRGEIKRKSRGVYIAG
jgi:hypothetical protein